MTKLKSHDSAGADAAERDDQANTVEKIIDRRIFRRRVQYLVKWKGCPISANSWEYKTKLHCTTLVAQFEKTRKANATKADSSLVTNSNALRIKKEPVATNSDAGHTSPLSTPRTKDVNLQTDGSPTVLNGFEKGYAAKRIMSAYKIRGEIYFFMEFDGLPVPELVRGSIVRAEDPQVVIHFYESRAEWPSDNGDPLIESINENNTTI